MVFPTLNLTFGKILCLKQHWETIIPCERKRKIKKKKRKRNHDFNKRRV